MNFINQLLENKKKRKVYSSFRDDIWGVDYAITEYIQQRNQVFIMCN